MSCNKVFEHTNEGFVLRVRLQPNSSSCQIKEIIEAENACFLKISVCSVPEKGKANKELIEFLAKKLKIAKSNMQIISGELDKYKKILIKTNDNDIITKIEAILKDLEN